MLLLISSSDFVLSLHFLQQNVQLRKIRDAIFGSKFREFPVFSLLVENRRREVSAGDCVLYHGFHPLGRLPCWSRAVPREAHNFAVRFCHVSRECITALHRCPYIRVFGSNY